MQNIDNNLENGLHNSEKNDRDDETKDDNTNSSPSTSQLTSQSLGYRRIREEHHNLFFSSPYFHPRCIVYYSPEHHAYMYEHSRARRKNRYPEIAADEEYWKRLVQIPKPLRLLYFDIKNVSFHVALYFTLGSVAWIVNGQVFMWPKQGNSDLPINAHIMGYSALVGGLLFWIGAYLGIVEALNEKSDGYYGFELINILHKFEKEPRQIQHFVHSELSDLKDLIKSLVTNHSSKGKDSSDNVTDNNNSDRDNDFCCPPVDNKNIVPDGYGASHLVFKSGHNLQQQSLGAERSSGSGGGDDNDGGDHILSNSNQRKNKKNGKKKWRWIGVKPRSVGWWATTIQFSGATCFTVAVISGTPGVLHSSQWQLQLALIWVMQIIGSICFVISSLILMLEEQTRWYKPALDRIGWHSQCWNTFGSLGFLLSASFGLLSVWGGRVLCCQFWGTGFNTYYGSWAFLISSVLLIVEVNNKEQIGFKKRLKRMVNFR